MFTNILPQLQTHLDENCEGKLKKRTDYKTANSKGHLQNFFLSWASNVHWELFSSENNERPVWWDLIAMVIMWFQSSSVGQRAPLGAESASFPRWIINEQQQHPQSNESLRNNTKRIIFQPGFFRLSIPELLFCHYQADEIHDALVIEDLVDSGHFKHFSCISSFLFISI